MVRASASITRLYVFMFGAFRIELNVLPISLPTRKIESFLAYLILHPEPHTREKLAALCWGDVSADQARASLRTALAAIRKHISAQLLIANRQSIQINSAYPMWVDVFAFEKGIKAKLQGSEWEGTPNEFQSEMNELQTAIRLYRGDLLSDFYDDWILPEREYYRNLYIDTLLRLVQGMRSHSEYERAIEFAQKVLVWDPANERAHQQLMFCYLATGDRSAALKQYEMCQRALRNELAVEPLPETTALFQWIRQAPPEVKAREAQITNLPIPLTSFIGRKREMAEVKYLLSTTRLFTLTGAGGSGKTRLAIQVSTDLLDGFKDGVWWVELAALKDETLVPQAVAKALGVHEQPNQSLIETLKNFMQFRHLLLVLDNCEHLIEVCAGLADELLRTCPNLKILATSREILDIDGESTWQVPTLSVPDLQPVSLVNLLMDYEAIRLFVERARAVKPSFMLTEENAPIVAQICQRLDGIPLAIELAATRVKMLSVGQIAPRLDDRFSLLTKGSRITLPRHQTLRAAIDWSYDLLRDTEQTLFQRLAVFTGGCTLDAVEQVCAGDGIDKEKVLDLLTHLLDKSLVTMQEEGGEVRYQMLETIWQYANEKLGKVDALRGGHASYFLILAETIEPFLEKPEQASWLDKLEREHNNFRAALVWAREKGQVELGLRLASALCLFWFMRGYLSEGLAQIGEFLSLSERTVNASTRAKALDRAGMLARYQGDLNRAYGLIAESLSLRRELGERHGIADSLSNLGFVVLHQGDFVQAHQLYSEALSIHRELDNQQGIADSLSHLALIAFYEGDYESAQAMDESSLAIWRALGDQQGIAWALHRLGNVKLHQSEYTAARDLFKESLAISNAIGFKWGIASAAEGLASAAASTKQAARAILIAAGAFALRQAIGIPLSAVAQDDFERMLAPARKLLGEEAAEAIWSEGLDLKIEQIIAEANEVI